MRSLQEQLFQYEQPAVKDASEKSSNQKVLLLNKTEDLLYAMRSRSDQQSFKILFFGILILTLLSSTVHILFYGYWAGIAGLILNVILFAFGNSRIRDAILLLKRSKQKSGSDNLNEMILYLEGGLDIKESRLQVLRIVFSILLPLNLIMLTELIIGRIGMIEIIIAGIMAIITWLFLFQSEYQQIFEFEDKIEDLKEEAEQLKLFVD